jgi:copper transport protein
VTVASRIARSWRVRHGLALYLAILLAFGTFGSALAHANLVRSTPEIGASLKMSPPEAQLWFSEAIEPGYSEALVYNTSQQRVDLGNSRVSPSDPASLIVSLQPNLPIGTYVIAWKTQSRVDGHVVRGTVPFGVGVAVVPSDTAIQGPAQGPVSGSPLEMVLRWLILLSTTAVVGAFVFWALQARATTELAVGPGLLPGQGRLAVVALAIFFVANLALLVLQTATTSDVSFVGALGAPVVQILTTTRYGGLWTGRVIVGALVGQILVARLRYRGAPPPPWDAIGVTIGAVLLFTISLTSHGAANDTPTPIGVLPVSLLVDWLHLCAVACWVGGLLQLAVISPTVLRSGSGPSRARFLGALVPRFSWVGGVSLGVLGATGLFAALQRVGTLDNLLNAAYGQALLVKLLLIVPLVTLAAINHYVVRPALVAAYRTASARTIRDALSSVLLFRWTVLIEALFGVAVIAAAGVLTTLSPPQQISATAGAASLVLTASAGDLVTTFTLAPGQPGPNRYLAAVKTATGVAAPGIQQVTVRFTFLDSNLGVSEVPLAATAGGQYAGQSSDLAFAGRWQAELVVRRTGQDDVRATYGFEVTPTGPRTLQPPQVQVSWQFFLGVLLAVLGIGALIRGAALRRFDLRRAAVVAACGVGLIGSGAYVAVRDYQVAEAAAALQAQSQVHPATPQSIANGAVVYRQNCAMCHGITARGNGPLAPTMNPRPSDLVLHVPLHSDTDLEDWIANGFPGSQMPAFKDKVTDQERWDVLNYLKSLADQASASAPAPVSTPTASPAPTGEGPTPTGLAVALAGTSAVSSTATATRQPTATSVPVGGLAQEKVVNGIKVAVKLQPGIFQPAQVNLTLTDPNGAPLTDTRRVDVQVAMAAMDHGAHGALAAPTGPGQYQAKAMLLAMEGVWWLAVRVERGDGTVDSTVFAFQVPRDTLTGAVAAMASRPIDPVQIEDIAVYPGEVTPDTVDVRAGHPVRLEVTYVNHPACGPTVRLNDPNTTAPVDANGLGELAFVPKQTATLHVTCSPNGLQISSQVK